LPAALVPESKMQNESTEPVRLKASKRRFSFLFLICVVFFLIALRAQFPRGIFYSVVKVLLVPASSFGMAVSAVGIFTSRYDAVLSADGIKFGTFFGKRHYRWTEIKAVYVLREVTGERVCIELRDQDAEPSGRIRLKNLPDNYGMKATTLARKLMRWQGDHGALQNN